MLTLIHFEFEKLLGKKKRLGFFVIIILFNIGLFAYFQNINLTFTNQAYQRLNTYLTTIPNEQRYDHIKTEYEKYQAFLLIEEVDQLQDQTMKEQILQENPQIEEYRKLYQKGYDLIYTTNLESKVSFLEGIYEEFEILHSYPRYLQNIQDKAKTISHISIFQSEDESNEKNIQKTAQDYQDLMNTKIVYEIQKGIKDAISFPLTMFLIIIGLFVLTSSMILEDKELHFLSIIKLTKRGQFQTMIAQGIVMMIMVGFLLILMLASQLLYMEMTIGLGDLWRSVQSLASYYQCPFSLTVGEFILWNLIIKWIVLSIIGSFMMLVMIIAKNRITAMMTIVSVIVVEYILYLLISPLSPFYLFKYINMMTLMQSEILFQIYRNVDIMGTPVSIFWIISFVIIVLMICLWIGCLVVYYRKKEVQTTVFVLPYQLKRRHLSLSLLGQEVYKCLWGHKVMMLMLLCIAILGYQYSQLSIYQEADVLVYKEYMKKLAGPLTSKKEMWIEKEQARYEDIHQKLADIQAQRDRGEITELQKINLSSLLEQQVYYEKVFDKVLQQYERILEDPDIEFVFDHPYEQVFFTKTWTFVPTLLLCFMTLLGSSQMLTFEYQHHMDQLTKITIHGRKDMITYKLIVSLLICVIFFFITMLPTLLLFQDTFGFSSWGSSVISLQQCILLPSWMNILMACLLSYFIKLLAIVCMVVIMHMIAIRTKNHSLTLFISVLLFFVPLLLSYGNIHFLEPISLYPLLMNSLYIGYQKDLILLLCSFMIYVSLGGYSLYYVYRHYEDR